ncbi:hypothetical protein [Phenylobacterium sp.]|uniref:hypothetical protein n=1 Tax=Phenylobacterium sp. TaxID=1871053 RepID=UPI0025F082BB|nr:hypothetical protein [Phenylobacterium sp.]MBX3482701.1 DUF4826 family protein [Phenylobacterium sp.]MCW5760915.1 DUF4826 family protein [Phenylobacterium sp.]
MTQLVDRGGWPVGLDIDYESDEEVAAIGALTAEARAFVDAATWSMPVEDLVFAFGVAPILGLYLLRFLPGGRPEDCERWVVVGDLPFMHFETDDTPTPALALQLYCAIAQDWADNVMDGHDLSESYPIPVAPTREYAEMLLGRVDFIRTRLIPLAQ